MFSVVFLDVDVMWVLTLVWWSKHATKPDGHDVVTVFCVMVDDVLPEQQYVAPKEVSKSVNVL